jgi:hypothetical protein
MTYTRLICTILIIALGIYDGVMVALYGIDGSVSRYFQDIGYGSPFVLITLGYILGHFFGWMTPNPFALIFSQKELDVLNSLAKQQGLTQQQTLVQALRLYQTTVNPIKTLDKMFKKITDVEGV